MIGSTFETQDGIYHVSELLGRGKSGFSYLIEQGSDRRVLKIMHDEQVAYYDFHGDKIRREAEAYEQLTALGAPIPELYEVNLERQYLVKAYVAGQTAAAAIAGGEMPGAVIGQLFAVADQLETNGINIDYFPTNFIVTPGQALVYIDYEVNPYSDPWNLVNWGIYYWVNTTGMRIFLETGDASAINQDLDRGIPVKEGLQDAVARLVRLYGRGA